MARNAETGELKQSAAAAQDDDTNDGGDGVVEEVEPLKHVSRRLASGKTYDETVNAGIDVFFSTVVLPAFYSALPPTVSLLDEDFNPMAEVVYVPTDSRVSVGCCLAALEAAIMYVHAVLRF